MTYGKLLFCKGSNFSSLHQTQMVHVNKDLSTKKNTCALCENLFGHLRFHLDSPDTLKAVVIPEVCQWNKAP